MNPSKARYVTACQQFLALGAVFAVLAPAAGVISLDVINQHPAAPGAAISAREPGQAWAGSANAADKATRPPTKTSTKPDARPAKVPEGPVDAVVQEYALTPESVMADQGTRQAKPGRAIAEAVQPDALKTPDAPKPDVATVEPTKPTVLTQTKAVDGFATVGVTWGGDTTVVDGQLTIRLRTEKDGQWSAWSDVPYDVDHGPDPGTAEADRTRPGTDAVIVGDVDNVQVRAVSTKGPTPDDMLLAVIAPGDAAASAVEDPAIDTAQIDKPGDAAGQPDPSGVATSEQAGQTQLPVDSEAADGATNQDTVSLQAGVITSKPQIFSRAQWGADERLRDRGSLRYFEVHAGFVHHTVNANNYTRAEVPGILRSIYAYHTQSKGWSDIGYNFLVDRFGRIWEGRYGGVSLPVVGAHTLGYNDYAFAMSAIGNYETAQPSAAMLDAYARLFAWKLSLHGVDVSSTRQWVGTRTFQAINGHRDAGSTACPGKYLYAKLPYIRTLAAKYQASWSGRQRDVNAISTPYPDIVVRKTGTAAGYLVPTQGLLRFAGVRVSAATGWSAMDTIVAVPDLTGDGRADVFARVGATAVARVYPGDGAGHFGAGIKATIRFKGFDQITAVGDLNADGRNDLVGHNLTTGRLRLFAGRGNGSFTSMVLSTSWVYNKTVGTGDFNGDGHADLLARDQAGILWLIPVTGAAKLGTRVQLAGAWSGYDVLTGYGDYDGNGRPDLFARSAKTGVAYVFPNLGNNALGHWLGPVPGFVGTQLLSSGGDLTDRGPTDLLGRRGDALVVYAHRGTYNTSAPVKLNFGVSDATQLLSVGDWDRDGDGDLVVLTKSGSLLLRRSNGAGVYSAPQTLATDFGKVRLLSAVGDMTGDGYPDLMGQPVGGAMRIYPGRGTAALGPSFVAHGAISAGRQYGAGLWNADGSPDSMFRSGSKLILSPGNGPGGLTGLKTLALDLTPYDWVLPIGDISNAGHGDLIVREKASGNLWVLPGSTTGFGAPVFLAQGFGGYDLAG